MATQKTKTVGAIRAGNGKYHFRVAKIKKVAAGTGYSTSHGGVVEDGETEAVIRTAGAAEQIPGRIQQPSLVADDARNVRARNANLTENHSGHQ